MKRPAWQLSSGDAALLPPHAMKITKLRITLPDARATIVIRNLSAGKFHAKSANKKEHGFPTRAWITRRTGMSRPFWGGRFSANGAGLAREKQKKSAS